MVLENTRSATHTKVLELLPDTVTEVSETTQKLIVDLAAQWFVDYKQFEREETFDRAYQDKRMTARMSMVAEDPSSGGASLKTMDAFFPGVVKTTVNQDKTIMSGLTNRLKPANFAMGASKKNELGLHDLSAVLLQPPPATISTQLFTKPGALPYFMPLPLEEDLRLAHDLGVAAKKARGGLLYQFYVAVRSEMTRIKYGAEQDLQSGMLVMHKQNDQKPHVRYAEVHNSGGMVDPGLLQTRAANALNYKTRIVDQATTGENNEVTVKYRKHAGMFPLIGAPGHAVPKDPPPNVPPPLHERYRWFVKTLGAKDYLLARFTPPAIVGKVSDDGVFTPF